MYSPVHSVQSGTQRTAWYTVYSLVHNIQPVHSVQPSTQCTAWYTIYSLAHSVQPGT